MTARHRRRDKGGKVVFGKTSVICLAISKMRQMTFHLPTKRPVTKSLCRTNTLPVNYNLSTTGQQLNKPFSQQAADFAWCQSVSLSAN